MESRIQIKSVHFRRILNSHGEFTNEFIIFLDNGSSGRGAPPKGETISIYEDKHIDISPGNIIEELKKDGMFDRALDQDGFDSYLEDKMRIFGRNNAYALSVAFYDAHEHIRHLDSLVDGGTKNDFIPKQCINILNGGNHAYTNPVQSDFHEFLLVAKTSNLESVINDHEMIQKSVKEKLAKKEKIYVNNNPVSKADHGDNRDWFDFLQAVLAELGLETSYDLMIDAAGTDLWMGKEYRFSITDDSARTSEEMCTYWFNLIKDYNLRMLEDPFHEKDFNSWHTLTNNQTKCLIVGDDLYSGNPERIREGIEKKYTHGIMYKPNQAGTVSNTINGIKLAQQNNQTLIMSHRSISTESSFLPYISNKYKTEYIKNGPIQTDYSAVIRLNEFIRLSGLGYE